MKAPLHCPVPGHTLLLLKRIAGVLAVVLLVGGGTSCASVTALRHEPVALDAAPRVIPSSVKAHLADGSTVLFPDGVTIEEARVTGSGDRYDIRLSPVGSVSEIARDSVVAMERFRTPIDGDRTMTYNFLTGLIGVVVGVAAVWATR